MRRGIVFAVGMLGGVALAWAAACSSDPDAITPDTDAAFDSGALDAKSDRRLQPDDPDGEVDASIVGPALLSQTGLYSDFKARTVSSELFAFAPRFEFWADGASKSRWLYLPPGTKIDTSQIDHWVFPVGTKAFKEFRYDGKLVETRLLMKVKDGAGNGVWWEAPYVWNADGSDAVATLAGVTSALDGGTHKVPSQIDCKNCHGDVSDVLIGVSAFQLSDPASPTTSAIAALGAAGRLTKPVPSDLDVPGTGVVKDALGYLHANCGHCHNDQAIKLNTQTKMRLRLIVGQTEAQTGAITTTVGTIMKHPLENGVTDVVVKGDPDRSGLWLRMNRRDAYGMPPAGTQVVDEAGVDTVRQWITGWQ